MFWGSTHNKTGKELDIKNLSEETLRILLSARLEHFVCLCPAREKNWFQIHIHTIHILRKWSLNLPYYAIIKHLILRIRQLFVFRQKFYVKT